MKTTSIEVSKWNLTKGIVWSLFSPPAMILIITLLIKYADSIDNLFK